MEFLALRTQIVSPTICQEFFLMPQEQYLKRLVCVTTDWTKGVIATIYFIFKNYGKLKSADEKETDAPHTISF